MRRLLICTTFALAFTGPAMAIDFTETIKTFDGKDFTDETGKPAPQVLGTIIENALLAPQPGDTPDDKNKKFWLALKIHEKGKDLTLTPDEIVLIRKTLAATVAPVLMGQALRMIDPTFKAPQ